MSTVAAIKELLTVRGLTLSTAESCTGGLIAHMLTNVPGVSDVYDGGFVTYTPKTKALMLGIEEKELQKHGAVSPVCARFMALGAKAKTGSDFALSVTGNLGPLALDNKPVGLVYFCVTSSRGETVQEKTFYGTRADIKNSAAHFALELLLREIQKWR